MNNHNNPIGISVGFSKYQACNGQGGLFWNYPSDFNALGARLLKFSPSLFKFRKIKPIRTSRVEYNFFVFKSLWMALSSSDIFISS